MSLEDRIVIDPRIRSGKPCIAGTRITVYDVVEYLAGGMSDDQILADFPSLTREDIRACLAFAALRERRLASLSCRLKLLFDENLSPRLLESLHDEYPGSTHVETLGMRGQSDESGKPQHKGVSSWFPRTAT